MTHAGPGMVNNPDLALAKNVLAVAPKVAAMVNLFLKLPKKLIGLKIEKKIFLVVKRVAKHVIKKCMSCL